MASWRLSIVHGHIDRWRRCLSLSPPLALSFSLSISFLFLSFSLSLFLSLSLSFSLFLFTCSFLPPSSFLSSSSSSFLLQFLFLFLFFSLSLSLSLFTVFCLPVTAQCWRFVLGLDTFEFVSILSVPLRALATDCVRHKSNPLCFFSCPSRCQCG